jgi:Ulp1 family protease
LEKWQHPHAELIGEMKIRRLEVEWTTYGNIKDCGVFTMRHMEMFKGINDADFKCGFASNHSEMKKQIDVLRKKYAARILLSDINKKKHDVVKAVGLEM